MKNLKIGILLMIICTLFTGVGEFLFKRSSETFQWDILILLTNYQLILGFSVCTLGAILLIIALKFGNLSTLYPIIALNFIWVTLISFFFFAEEINHFKIWAIVFVIFGIVLIARSDENDQ
jgi:drug/metabolite transporter (DMT)-like permease